MLKESITDYKSSVVSIKLALDTRDIKTKDAALIEAWAVIQCRIYDVEAQLFERKEL